MALRAKSLLYAGFQFLALVTAAPTAEDYVRRRSLLLGSNFGVPNINATYDYVIVGGGNAGLTIAARLSEGGNSSVAVVEAGSFYEITNGNVSQIPLNDVTWTGKSPLDTNPLIDWSFTTTPQVGALNASVHYARGKTLGGCSARNYMAYQRGTIDSYQQWADQVGDQSYAWNNFLPYFEKSVTFTPPNPTYRLANATPQYDAATLGNGSPLSVTFPNWANAYSTWAQRGLKQIGIHPINGFTSGKLIGSAWLALTVNQTQGTRASSETQYLRPALGRSNLYVYVDTLATRILFADDCPTKATAVEVQSGNLKYILTAKKEVIVAAGAFQSPQLLMVSGIGPKATLDKFNIPVIADRPGVGGNMWDHVLFGPSYRVSVITASELANSPTFAPENIEAFHDNPAHGIFTSNGADFLAWEKVPPHLRASFSPATKAALAQFPSDWPELEFLFVGGYFGYQENYIRDAPVDGYNYATIAMALIAPLSRGNISISSADMNDQPLINPNWLADPADAEVAVAAYKRARELAATPAMQEIIIGQEYFPGLNVSTDAEILHLIRQSLNSVFHAVGTCAMGKTNDSMAVVDNYARVIGTENLRVVDASAFPFLVPGHPMSTVYALAEKISDDIRSGS